jgi:hypothetical protein
LNSPSAADPRQPTPESMRGQILSESRTDATSSRWYLYGSCLKKPSICPLVASRAAYTSTLNLDQKNISDIRPKTLLGPPPRDALVGTSWYGRRVCEPAVAVSGHDLGACSPECREVFLVLLNRDCVGAMPVRGFCPSRVTHPGLEVRV